MLPNSGAILPGDGQTAFTVAEGSFVMCLLWSVPFIVQVQPPIEVKTVASALALMAPCAVRVIVQMVIAFFFHIYLWFTRCFRLCSPMP
jgi:hypothetical protein